MPVIALTGATGFVGRAIVRRLTRLESRPRLRLLVRNPDRRRLPRDLTGREIVAGSLAEPAALKALVAGADAIVHVAGSIAGNSAADFDEANVVGARRLLDAVDEVAPDAHLIWISSLAARHPELSWYAASKRAGEELAAARARGFSILRPPAVYGPEDPALAAFWRQLARGWLIRLGPVSARFSLLHADDLAESVARLYAHGPANRIATLAGPQPEGGWSWAGVAAAATEARGARVREIAVPGSALRAIARAAQGWARISGQRLVLSPGKARELLHPDWVCDNLALEAALNWRPTTALRQALATLPGWSRA